MAFNPELNITQGFQLIHQYQHWPILWNPNKPDFGKVFKRKAAIEKIVAKAHVPNLTTKQALHFFNQIEFKYFQLKRKGTPLTKIWQQWLIAAHAFLKDLEMPNNLDQLHYDMIELYKLEPILWNCKISSLEAREASWKRCAEQLKTRNLTGKGFQKVIRTILEVFIKRYQILQSDDGAAFCAELKWFHLAEPFLRPVFFDESGNLKLDACKNLGLTIQPAAPTKNLMMLESIKHNLMRRDGKLQLITLFKKYEALWNPQHPDYRHKPSLEKTWQDMADELGIEGVTAEECKSRVTGLRYRYRQICNEGSVESLVSYKSKNPWFVVAESFLGPLQLKPIENKKHKIAPKHELAQVFVEEQQVLESPVTNENELLVEEIKMELIENSSTSCRACFTDYTSSPQLLKCLKSTDQDKFSLAEIYSVCIGYDNCEAETKLPAVICCKCEQLLLDFYKFRSTCRDLERIFMVQLQPSEEVATQKAVENESERKAESVIDEVDEQMLVEYLEEIPSECESIDHEKKAEPKPSNDDGLLACEVCDKKYKKNCSLATHMKIKHGQITKVSPKKEVASKLEQTVQVKPPEMPFACHLCDKFYDKPGFLTHHMKTKHPLNIDTPTYRYDRSKYKQDGICPICGKIQKYLSSHMLTHGDRALKYECSKCDKKYRTYAALRFHIKSAHEGFRWICLYCPMSFISQTSRKLHIHKNHFDPEVRVTCPECPKTFSSEFVLKRHKRISHTFKIFQCGECDKTFTCTKSMNLHKDTKHSGKQFVCSQCDKIFSHQRFLKRHMILHTGEKNYECPVCYQLFYQNIFNYKKYLKSGICEICGKMQRYLASHILRHKRKPISYHMCTQCDRKYASVCGLNAHIKLAHEGFRYTCEYCPMKFLSITGRKFHIHKNHLVPNDRLTCDKCPRTFSSALILKRHHVVSHTFRIYQCDQCSITVKNLESLKFHKESKHAVNHLVCNFCEKVFNHKRSLKRHMIIHTNVKNYTCPVCPDVSFYQNAVLRSHVQNQHPDYKLPPKGTTISGKILADIESKKKYINSLVKIKSI